MVMAVVAVVEEKMGSGMGLVGGMVYVPKV